MTLGELHPCGGGDVIPLNQPKLLVGRRSHCDICLAFSNVSSHHCELELKSGYWHVRDLGSMNGTKVNGMRVDTKCLMPGDELMIAKHAYHVDYTIQSDQEAPEEQNPFSLSLMEKAGLEYRRPQRSDGDNAKSTHSSRRGSSKDDFLMEWLSDD
ncbi:MAG: FHA domain-containing protein [Planctomycetaceae bacterium]